MENMDWGALGFDYRKTDANVRYYYTDGKWSEMEVTSISRYTCRRRVCITVSSCSKG